MVLRVLAAGLLNFAVQAFTAVTIQGGGTHCGCKKTKDGEMDWIAAGDEDWKTVEGAWEAGQKQLKAGKKGWGVGKGEWVAEEEQSVENKRDWKAGEGERRSREQALLQQVAIFFQSCSTWVTIVFVCTFSFSRPSVISNCQLPENEEIYVIFKQGFLHLRACA